LASGLATAAPALANGGCGETFSGGDGSSGNPYLISEAADVTALKGDFNCWASGTYFEQTADVDMGGITWTDHAIGYNNSSRQFEGNYNGGGFEINGLTIDFGAGSTDEGDYAGFFGELEGNVSNLGFTGTVSGDIFVGGLVGGLGNAKQISNSYATGSVSGEGSVGGLVGYSRGVSGTSDNLVSRSFATGSVESKTRYAGGLIGSMRLTSVADSYATGAVTSDSSDFGGLIGYNRDSTLVRSYSIGSVQGLDPFGGLIGVNDSADVGTSFWDIPTSGRSSGAGESKNGGTFNAVGATTAQMQTLSTFEDANWSIADSWVSSNTWGICEGSGYPYLTWQYTSDSEACGGGANPDPPAPTPATPPSAPTSAEATAGDDEVTVTWEAPASQGSFPVTNYQVQSTPSSQGCLVPATATSCKIAGLHNGTKYTFQVRALNGGGWGSWATTASVTPGPGPDPEASIMITGSRSANERVARVRGETTGLAGATLQSMVRLSDRVEFTAGSTREVASDGSFTWQRRAKPQTSVEVYFMAGDVTSNTVTIAGRR